MPVTYSLLSGTLPPGLTLSTTGLISGTPTTGPGTYSCWIRARNANGSTTEQAFSLTVNMAPITINPQPATISFGAGTGGTQNVFYRFSSTSPVNLQLTSSTGVFVAAGETIAANPQSLQVTLINGSGQAAETVSVPVSIIQKALARKATAVLYQRVFNYNFLTSTVVFNLTGEAALTLTITRMALYFENRRPEISVDQNIPGLKAFADINFVGSGLLQGYWEVDGRVFSYVNQQAVYGQTLTLTTPEVPALPTFDPGSHSVRFVVTNPVTSLTFPNILYYVVPKERKEKCTLLTPGNNTVWEYGPLFFEWESAGRSRLYVIEFFKEEDLSPIFSAFTRTPDYRLPGLILSKFFNRNRIYHWKVKGLDRENRILGESDLWNFRFK